MTEQEQTSIFYQVLRVVYAPRRAFREIKDNPRFLGAVLILILYTAVNLGASYMLLSKYYIEQTVPTFQQGDMWTENATLWTALSGVAIAEDFTDFINGSIYGNRSLGFSIMNSSILSAQLGNIGPVNCEGTFGYKNLTIRVKVKSPETGFENVSVYLFSDISSYFQYDLTESFSNYTNDTWNNLTIPLATTDWSSNGTQANWTNVTGLKIEFQTTQNSNISILLDGLFFRGVFKTPLDMGGSGYLFSFSMVKFTEFVVQWFAISVVIYVIANAFGVRTMWRPVLVFVGFALMTLFVQAIINAAVFANMPRLYYPLEYIGGVGLEGEAAFNTIAEQTWLFSLVGNITQTLMYIWTVALCAIATRQLTELSWARSILISVVALFASVAVGIFLGI